MLCTVAHYSSKYDPDSKVHGANMGPYGADRTQVGPMLAPWTLPSGDFFSVWRRIGLDKMADILQRIFWNGFSSINIILFFTFVPNKSKSKWFSGGLGNGLAPKTRQAVIWTNVDWDAWRYMGTSVPEAGVYDMDK